jgi:hypothetical protein
MRDTGIGSSAPERNDAVAISLWDRKEDAEAYNREKYQEVLKTDESDLILKSLLFAEHGNHFVFKSLGKLLRAIDLQLHTDVASIHINLLGWTANRVEDFGLT